jgi:hypothetical protein
MEQAQIVERLASGDIYRDAAEEARTLQTRATQVETELSN